MLAASHALTRTCAVLRCARTRVFKVLAVNSPPHVTWVFTGSRVAIFWANVAQAPVNGYSLLTHVTALHLPPRVSPAAKEHAWAVTRELFAANGIELPEELRDQAPDQHATLVYFCAEWARPPREADVPAFCDTLRKTKLYPEVRLRWARRAAHTRPRASFVRLG